MQLLTHLAIRVPCVDMRTQHYRVRSGEDLGRVLRDARTAHGLTQQQMVDRFELGFDRTRLARIEAGEGFQSLDRALSVLRHRVRLAPELDIEGLSVDQVLRQLLDQVAAPRL